MASDPIMKCREDPAAKCLMPLVQKYSPCANSFRVDSVDVGVVHFSFLDTRSLRDAEVYNFTLRLTGFKNAKSAEAFTL